MSDDEEDAADSGEWNSAPFCRHWGDPSDCDIPCANPKCGHLCCNHGYPECGQPGCECDEYLREAP